MAPPHSALGSYLNTRLLSFHNKINGRFTIIRFFRLLFGAPLLFVYLLLWFCVWSCSYKQQIVIKIVATWKSLLDSDKQSFSPKAG